MIIYAPLWRTMKEKGISTYTLIEKYKISSSTIHRLRTNVGVTTQTIDDLCVILNCKVEDIMLFVPPENKKD